ncbi:O-methyltransferase [Cohnella kolymensis]|uniref:O-methyltransferase n=1 Tax=Cohnella kolymensis TaxID=1590652 RepID=UPI001F3BF2EF|nr:O-methyltransferase [Cohnella kolymensis]
MEQNPLARQIGIALEQLEGELKGLTAGTIVLQIRNDTVGKFGIRHLPVDCGSANKGGSGMSAAHVQLLRRLALEALQHKNSWTHGEISYDFVLKQDQVYVSMQIESNYNMANHMFQLKRRDRREARTNSFFIHNGNTRQLTAYEARSKTILAWISSGWDCFYFG